MEVFVFHNILSVYFVWPCCKENELKTISSRSNMQAISSNLTIANSHLFSNCSHTPGNKWTIRLSEIILHWYCGENCHKRELAERIQWTSGRAMYRDSAMVSCRPRGVGLEWSSSSWFLPVFFFRGRPQRRDCNDGARKKMDNTL